MPPKSPATEFLIESHETRLQGVETRLSEVQAEVAGLTSEVKNVGEKIDAYQSTVVQRLESHIQDDLAVKVAFAKVDERLAGIEAKKKRSLARRDMLLKALVGLFFGAAGAAAKMLIDRLIKG